MVERKPLGVVVPDGETPSIGEFRKKGMPCLHQKIEKAWTTKKQKQNANKRMAPGSVVLMALGSVVSMALGSVVSMALGSVVSMAPASVVCDVSHPLNTRVSRTGTAQATAVAKPRRIMALLPWGSSVP